MAEIQLSWTKLPDDTSDVDSIEVWRCDDGSVTTEEQFQAELDKTTTVGITSGFTDLDYNSSDPGLNDTVNPYSTTTYNYAVVAKNAYGYKVGASTPDGTAVSSVEVIV